MRWISLNGSDPRKAADPILGSHRAGVLAGVALCLVMPRQQFGEAILINCLVAHLARLSPARYDVVARVSR
jgi:hypothetical protein